MSWTLYIHTVKGKTNALCVEPSHTVLSVKKSIKELIGLQVHLQKLLFNGKHLDDNQATLLSYDVQNWAKIILVAQAEPEEDDPDIVIKTLSGKSIFVQAKLSDTVADICTKIQNKEGMASEQQQLVYGGKVLDWDMPLDRYNIQRGSSLHVVCATAQRRVFFRLSTTPGAKADVIPLPVLLSDSVEKVSKKLAEKFNLPPDQQELFFKGVRLEKSKSLGQCSITSDSVIDVQGQGIAPSQEAAVPQDLFVRTPIGRMVSIKFLPTDTIKSIKEKVHTKVGLEPERQVLLLAGNPLEDDATLSSYNVSAESTFHVVLRPSDDPHPESGDPIQIFVRTVTGKTFMLAVSLSDMIGDVKAKIENLKGIPSNQQELLIRGEPLRDSLKLRDCNIETESTFYLTLTSPRKADDSLRLFIRTAEKTQALRVSADSTVKQVKEDIFAVEKVPVEYQRLFLGSMELRDEAILSSHGIQSNHSLSLRVVDPVALQVVYIRNLLGKTVSVEISSTDKVKTLKSRVFAKEGIPVEQQRLVFHGVDLDDEQFINHYNIEQESNLQLALTAPDERVRISIGVPTATPGELKSLTLEIPLASKVQDLKIKVHEIARVLPNKQVLFAGSRELRDDNATLEFYNVAMHDFLRLKIKSRDRVIFIKNLKHTISLSVSLDDKVIDVKAKVEKKEGIDSSRQRLLFQGAELEDDSILAKYEIDQRSTLIMSLKEVAGYHKMQVRMPSGSIFPVDVYPGDTIASVKYALQRYKHVPIGRQNLVNESGAILHDETKAAAAGDILSMELRPVAVSVVATKYDCHSKPRVISVKSVTTVNSLQQQVEAALHMPGNRLRLFHNGTRLTNELSHLLEDDSVIMLGKCCVYRGLRV